MHNMAFLIINDIDHNLHLQNTSQTLPSWESYEVYIVDREINCVIREPHCHNKCDACMEISADWYATAVMVWYGRNQITQIKKQMGNKHQMITHGLIM